jgi:hypothetical protein
MYPIYFWNLQANLESPDRGGAHHQSVVLVNEYVEA